MRACVLREVKQPVELERRAPLEPGPGEVVVRLHAAGLNRRDYWITQGLYPGLQLPCVLGSDGAGVVTRRGPGVQWDVAEIVINPAWEWGDDSRAQSARFRILGMPAPGTWADEVLVPVEYLHARPEGLSWEQAAALPLAGLTAYRAVFHQGGLRSGQRVLVTGIGGGVATLATQFAVAAGAQVAVTSSSPDKLRQAEALGVVAGFNYHDDAWTRQLLEQCGPPDLIVDGAGGEGYEQLVELAAPGGRIVSYGATAGPARKLDLFKVFWKQLQLCGSTMGSPDDFRGMLELVATHGIQPVIDRILPLEEANEALERMRAARQFGKQVLRIES